MKTFIDIEYRELAACRFDTDHVEDLAVYRMGPLAYDFMPPQLLASRNAWRVWFSVPDSPEGLLL